MRNTSCRFNMLAAAVIGALVSQAGMASELPDLATFQEGAPARAADVNDKFTLIKDAVNDNNARLGTVEAASATQAASITTINAKNTAQDTSITAINTKNTTQDSSIGTLNATTADHETRIKAAEVTVDGHTTKIDALNNGLAFGRVPVGTIVAWNKTATGTPALPDGWLECDGQVVFDTASPYYTKTLPSLNGTNLFLRGATASGTTGGSTTHTHTFTQTASDYAPDASHYADGSIANPANHLPPYFDIVWIIRVK